MLGGTTVRTDDPSPRAAETSRAAIGPVSDCYSRNARRYGAKHPLSISNGIKRPHNTTNTFPSTDDTSADGDDGNYGDGGAGSSNFSVDIVAESETNGVSPAGKPLSFKMYVTDVRYCAGVSVPGASSGMVVRICS